MVLIYVASTNRRTGNDAHGDAGANQRLAPAQFNPLLDQVVRGIAVNAVANRGSGFGKIVRLKRTIEAGTGQAL
jgi:hypothetical protein